MATRTDAIRGEVLAILQFVVVWLALSWFGGINLFLKFWRDPIGRAVLIFLLATIVLGHFTCAIVYHLRRRSISISQRSVQVTSRLGTKSFSLASCRWKIIEGDQVPQGQRQLLGLGKSTRLAVIVLPGLWLFRRSGKCLYIPPSHYLPPDEWLAILDVLAEPEPPPLGIAEEPAPKTRIT